MSIHIPISDDYMRVLCPDSIIVHYNELPAIDNINQILGANGKCIILYLTAKFSGHYTCLFKRNNKLYFFNSYGEPVDFDFKFIKDKVRVEEHEDKPYLKLLIERSGLPVDVNQYCIQAKDTATCGYHCAVRLWNTNKNNEKYVEDLIESCHKEGMTPDEMVVYLCQKRHPSTEDPRDVEIEIEGGLVYNPEEADKIYHMNESKKIDLIGYKDIKSLPKDVKNPIEFMKMPEKIKYLGREYKIFSECKVVGSSAYKFETPFSDIDGLNFIEFEEIIKYSKKNISNVIVPTTAYFDTSLNLPRSEILYDVENPELLSQYSEEGVPLPQSITEYSKRGIQGNVVDIRKDEILRLMLIGCIAFGRGIIEIVNKLIATSSKTGYIFSDFKCGYKYKTYEAIEQRKEELFRGSLQRSLEDILKPEDITRVPRHWTSEEILDPKNQHELFISIFDTFYRREDFYVKLDIFCVVKEKYYEASMSYASIPTQKLRNMVLESLSDKSDLYDWFKRSTEFVNKPDDLIQLRIQDEILKKILEGNIFKSVKRLFSIARLSKDKSLLSKILPLLNSDVGVLNTNISSMKTLVLMFNEYVDYDVSIIQKELKIIRGQLHEISKRGELTFNNELPNINKKLEIISKELNGVMNKNEKDSIGRYSSKLLNEICSELNKIVNKETREYMSKININLYRKDVISQTETFTPRTLKY